MLAEAIGLAFLSALSPTALLVVAIFLGAANPRRMILLFLCGAVVMSVVAGLALFAVLRAGGLSLPAEREANYSLRLGLGLLALALGAGLAVRAPRPEASARRPSLVLRLAARPGQRAAFSAGLLVFVPGVTYVAAVQVVATTPAAAATAVLALALVVTIDVMFAWLPLLLFEVAPDATQRWLDSANGWLREHGRQVLISATTLAGLVLFADGVAGMAR